MSNIYYIKCHAKINLFLHVLGKTAQNYHSLDSMVMFVEDLYDELTIELADENQILLKGKYQENLSGINILDKVITEFSDWIGNSKFKITLVKNIPIAAGLGGGSSDAAELIKFFIKKFKLQVSQNEMLNRCAKIGADVPMFLYKKPLYFNGIGEMISTIDKIPSLFALLVYPNIAMSTATIFNSNNISFSRDTIKHQYSFKDHSELFQFLRGTKNDLLANTTELAPELSNIIAEISSCKGCEISRMSGTGTTCFGIFSDVNNANLALNTLQIKFPDYFTCVSKLF